MFSADFSEDFLSCCTKNKRNVSLVTSTGLPREAVMSFSEYTWSQIGGLVNVLFRCRAFFFQVFLPFAMICDPHHLENFLKCVIPNNSQHLLSVHVILGLREKSSN